jgi:hypothetical protein
VTAALAAVLADRPYPADVRLRASTLKAIGRSALHCMHAMRSPYEPTLAMRLGLGAHSLLLGGPPVVTYPGKVRRGKEWDAFELEHAGSIILSEREAETAHAINEAIRADPISSRVLFQPGMIYEDTIEFDWQDKPFRATPDARGHRHVVDLKTTRDAEPERFQRDAIRMAYHAQLALYGLAMEAVNGHKPTESYIVAVESKPPHAVTVLELTPRAIDAGERLCREWLDKFKACEAAGSWPGYAQAVVPFDVLPSMDDFQFADDDATEEGTEEP